MSSKHKEAQYLLFLLEDQDRISILEVSWVASSISSVEVHRLANPLVVAVDPVGQVEEEHHLVLGLVVVECLTFATI